MLPKNDHSTPIKEPRVSADTRSTAPRRWTIENDVLICAIAEQGVCYMQDDPTSYTLHSAIFDRVTDWTKQQMADTRDDKQSMTGMTLTGTGIETKVDELAAEVIEIAAQGDDVVFEGRQG